MKILLGLVGQYRTFEKTYENIFENLIDNNEEHDFDIIANTDFNNMNVNATNKKGVKVKDYRVEELIPKLKACYGDKLIKIMNYENKITNISGSMLFRKRIENILENLKTKYDLYIFLRFDVAFEKPVSICDFKENSFNVICGSIEYKNRQDHNRDWDFCFVFDKPLFFYHFLGRYADDDIPYTKNVDPYKLKEMLVNSNVDSSYIDKYINDKQCVMKWVENFWILLYNISVHGCCVNFEKNNFLTLVR